jgi:surface antigen
MRSDARAIFMAGLAAADPVRAVHAYCRLDGGTLHIGSRSYALHTIDRI